MISYKFFPAFVAVLLIFSMPAFAQSKSPEAFVNKMGTDAIGFLSNEGLSVDQKANQFEVLLQQNFDIETIGRFALGRYWRTATPEQQQEYLRLFENMIIRVYSRRFNDYEGQSFEVGSSRSIGDRDQLVTSYIVPDRGSKIKVDWRLRPQGNSYKIVDVVIEGVSMAVTQRSDFSSVIQRGGGRVESLLDYLRR